MRFLPVAMFLGTGARSFVLGPWDVTVTLRWTGWILGISPFVTVATAPVRGRWAERGNPGEMYVGCRGRAGRRLLGARRAGRAASRRAGERADGARRLVGALAPLDSVWPYGTMRFVQKLAPVFPIVVTRLAQHARDQAIGVYAALALVGLACLPAVTASRGHA